jgi:hypothetical protein
MLFSERPYWLARNPVLRRNAVHVWRGLLRMRRATFAKAVLVARHNDGRVLVVRAASGAMRLPAKSLDAWLPIATQVEEMLEQLLQQRPTPSLVAIDGTPSWEGVTFLYTATLKAPAAKGHAIWLELDVAPAAVSGNDNRLIRLSTGDATEEPA